MKYCKSVVGEIVPVYKKTNQVKKAQIKSSRNSQEYMREVWSEQLNYLEEMYLLPLNRANYTLGWVKISQGGTSGTIIDIKVIMQVLLQINASSFILFHNHPSGNTNPSKADIDITKKLKAASEVMELPLLDHIVLTEDSYYSFADEGIL